MSPWINKQPRQTTDLSSGQLDPDIFIWLRLPSQVILSNSRRIVKICHLSVLRLLGAKVVNYHAVFIFRVSIYQHQLVHLQYFFQFYEWMFLSFNRFTHLLKLNPKGNTLSCILAKVVYEEGFALIAVILLLSFLKRDL